MINYKIDNGLQEWSKWQEISFVNLKGDPTAQKFQLPNTIENADENEEVIQSWKKIAVLSASSDLNSVPFYIGYYDESINLFLFRFNGGIQWAPDQG